MTLPVRAAVSITEAARRLGCSRRTIYNYIAQNRLVVRRTLAGVSCLSVEDLRKDPRYMDVPTTVRAKQP